MKPRASRSKTAAPEETIEEFLEMRYAQLLKWGNLLTRGDTGTAQEIVHDFCLYVALTKPDFSEVTNLDGYLYTSLRHIYLSWIAKSSREALRFTSIGDYDSIQFAFANTQPRESIDSQNDLRAICCYAVWRKNSSKSFSYFILHFFHGYFPREIAEIACLPLSAIYNKLKTSRAELRHQLAAPEILRSIKNEVPPEAVLSRTPVSSVELFRELRETILQPSTQECLPEDELLAHYRTAAPSPLSCSLLSHLVSCERCLALVDRHFRRPTLKDRDSLDGFDRSLNMKSVGDEGTDHARVRVIIDRVLKQKNRIYQHRPRTLSIAVNGRIVAFHDVQGDQSVLSARVEHPERTEFVEVFSEQGIRLALVTVDTLPPDGPNTLMQRVSLSDGRWLELNLSFDGMALQTEVAYFDPVLGTHPQEDAEEAQFTPVVVSNAPGLAVGQYSTHSSAQPGLIASIVRYLRPSPALTWAIALAFVLCGSGYLIHHYAEAPLSPEAILNRSISIEANDLKGNSEHQVLHLVETSASGRLLNATVDLWKDDESGRYMRRLYDDQHHLIAAEWRGKEGRTNAFVAPGNAAVSDEDRQIATNELWKQDLSSRAFRALAGHTMQISATDTGYELSTPIAADNGQHLVSAVLVLDRHLHPVSEILHVRSTSGVQEVLFVQTGCERQPSSTVPDAVFSPASMGLDPSESYNPLLSSFDRHRRKNIADTERHLTQLGISVLYQLHQTGADIGDPIEITKTPDGHIRVYGTLSDDQRKAQIISQLEALPDGQFLQVRLRSQNDRRMPAPTAPQLISPLTTVYSIKQSETPAEVILNKYFMTKGLTSDRARAAATQFSLDALAHSQRALQHAYALDRLGNSFTSEELQSVGPTFQRQWAQMTIDHASALEREFRLLRDKLTQIAPDGAESSTTSGDSHGIDTPAAFAHAADQLLRQTQSLNRMIGDAFSSGISRSSTQSPNLLILNTADSIPLREATEIDGFAERLTASGGIKNASNVPAETQLQNHTR